MIKRGEVKLENDNGEWFSKYEDEKQNIIDVIGNQIISIEHVGSTAIPGLIAKPIIDIVVGLKDLNMGYDCINKLSQIGYIYKGSLGKSNRFFFYKLENEYEVYHLHLVQHFDNNWLNLILFRDYLILHKKTRNDYQALKQELVNDKSLNREDYTKRKSDFILKVIKLAKQTIKYKRSDDI